MNAALNGPVTGVRRRLLGRSTSASWTLVTAGSIAAAADRSRPMNDDDMVMAGARALAKTHAPTTRWDRWSEDARGRFVLQSRAVLEAAGVIGR